jgi:hypothetical protein
MSLEPVFKQFGSTGAITVYSRSTYGEYGQPVLSTGVSYRARVMDVNKMVTDPSGQEVMATHRVWILSTSTGQWSITTEHTARLAGDSTGERRQVVSVEQPTSLGNASHHTVLNLGVNPGMM